MTQILVINPNTTQQMTDDIGDSARKHAAADTVVIAATAPWGPRSIEGHFEEVVAASATVDLIARHRNDYDAFVIACYGDPGLFAAKEVTDHPVLGIGEASTLLACTVAHRFSVVTVIDRIVPMLEDMVTRYGLSSRCASVRTSGLTVLEIEQDQALAAERIAEAARRAVHEDGAEAICLGCAGMGSIQRQVAELLPGVPVIDGVVAAVKQAEALVGAGLRTSKVRAFARPESKEFLPPTDPNRPVTTLEEDACAR